MWLLLLGAVAFLHKPLRVSGYGFRVGNTALGLWGEGLGPVEWKASGALGLPSSLWLYSFEEHIKGESPLWLYNFEGLSFFWEVGFFVGFRALGGVLEPAWLYEGHRGLGPKRLHQLLPRVFKRGYKAGSRKSDLSASDVSVLHSFSPSLTSQFNESTK